MDMFKASYQRTMELHVESGKKKELVTSARRLCEYIYIKYKSNMRVFLMGKNINIGKNMSLQTKTPCQPNHFICIITCLYTYTKNITLISDHRIVFIEWSFFTGWTEQHHPYFLCLIY